MPAISGNEKNELIQLLVDRKVRFYHACQLQDFETYIKMTGIPSRNLMQQSGLPFTEFDTDEADQANAVWNMVFGNLQDSGKIFAERKFSENTAPTPNAFGPILLLFSPHIFDDATDVAICLRSAGGRGFDRNAEALPDIQEVNKIFVVEDIEEAVGDDLYKRAFVKYISDLKNRFDNPQAATPEVSCSVKNEMLSLKHLVGIVVDRYIINGESLFDVMSNLKDRHGLNGFIKERHYGENRAEIKQELADLLLTAPITIAQINANLENSDQLRDWTARLARGKRDFDFDRFAKYLRNGTLLRLQEISNVEPDIFDSSTW